MDQVKRNSAYWRDLALSAAGAVCLLASLGHFLDWIKDHHAADRSVAVGSLLGYALLVLIVPNRLNFAIFSLVCIAVWGVLGLIASRNLSVLFIVLPCAAAAYLLFRWKGQSLK
jgi:hypothetical protein